MPMILERGIYRNAKHWVYPNTVASYNERVSRDLRPAIPIGKNKPARGAHVSEAPTKSADPQLNALLKGTAEIFC